MKVLTLIILAFTLLFSCSRKKGNFSVSAPVGWLRFDTLSKTNRKYVKMRPAVKSSVPVFVENINIGIMNYPSIELYIKNLMDDTKDNAFYFEEVEKGVTKINQYNMRWQQYKIQLEKNSDLVEQKVYFIGDKGNIYQIVCSAEPNEITKIQNKIDAVLTSFKIL